MRGGRIVGEEHVALDAIDQHQGLRRFAGVERIPQTAATEEFHAHVRREVQAGIGPEQSPATQQPWIRELRHPGPGRAPEGNSRRRRPVGGRTGGTFCRHAPGSVTARSRTSLGAVPVLSVPDLSVPDLSARAECYFFPTLFSHFVAAFSALALPPWPASPKNDRCFGRHAPSRVR